MLSDEESQYSIAKPSHSQYGVRFNCHCEATGDRDFPHWKRRIIALLQVKDYDVVINYDSENVDPRTNAVDVSNDPVKQRVHPKASGCIELNVEDSVLPYLVSQASAHSYWVTLHSVYQRKSLSAIVGARRNMFNCTQDGRSAQQYVGAVEQHARALQIVGVILADQVMTALVVCNLDAKYANLATSLDCPDVEQ